MRVRAISVVAAVMMLIGCASDDEPPASDGSPIESSATPSGSASDVLEGSWQTTLISPDDVEETVRQHDLSRHLEGFEAVTPLPEPMVLTLDLHEGEWDLYGQPDGGPRQEIDYDAEYTIDGDEVVVAHADGATTFRWSVDGESLTLVWLSTTLPEYKGIPEEVFQRALYMTEDFTRQD
jgi:hypothetical protein